MGELSDLAAIPVRVRLRARLIAQTVALIGAIRALSEPRVLPSTASSPLTFHTPPCPTARLTFDTNKALSKNSCPHQ